MSREEMIRFFTTRNDAWNRHDVAALTEDHMEEGEVDSPVWGHVKGRPFILEIYAQWFLSFPDAEFFSDDLLIDGNRAVQFGKMIGTHKCTFCGLSPTGKRFTIRCAFKFVFDGSKIATETRIYDFTGMLLQLGVLAAKPAF
jgi:predicted ester cyclase